jgi:putative hydrolase of the HAD superfamily
MIKNIIFDFGDVFINLNKTGLVDAFTKMGLQSWPPKFATLNEQFEIGAITETAFLTGFQRELPSFDCDEIKKSWNCILADFPQYRLDFLKQLVGKYRLFLLSNTDAIHIAHFEQKVGPDFYNAFYNSFEKVYFSFEMGDRKPNNSCYEQVLLKSKIKASETLFVDDKLENIKAAHTIGLQTWHLKVGDEDVVSLLQNPFLKI